MSKGQVIQTVDVEDVIKFIITKNSRINAVFLAELEKLIDKDSEIFPRIRKLYLDTTNGYCRAVLKSVFGDIED